MNHHLVENGAVDIWSRSEEDDFSKLAIHLAAVFGHVDTVRYFIDLDGDLATAENIHGDSTWDTTRLFDIC